MQDRLCKEAGMSSREVTWVAAALVEPEREKWEGKKRRGQGCRDNSKAVSFDICTLICQVLLILISSISGVFVPSAGHMHYCTQEKVFHQLGPTTAKSHIESALGTWA